MSDVTGNNCIHGTPKQRCAACCDPTALCDYCWPVIQCELPAGHGGGHMGRGFPPGDTPAPDLAKLQSVIEGALLEWTRGDPNDLLTDEEWARTVAQFLAARLCNAGSHAVFFEGGAAAGSSAPPAEGGHVTDTQTDAHLEALARRWEQEAETYVHETDAKTHAAAVNTKLRCADELRAAVRAFPPEDSP